MKIDEYITYLRSKNIIISVHEGQLAVHDDDDALTQEIIQELKSQKEDIITFFEAIKNKNTLIPITKAPELILYPVSSAQRRMFFLHEFDKEDTSYNIPLGFKVNGKLDIVKLEASILKLINRHECLRTVYLFEGDTIYQKVIGVEDFALDYKDGNLETVDKEFAYFVKPFNLKKDYPIRIRLLIISKDVYFLFIDIHHIASDLHSIELLTKDLLSFYNGYDLPKLKLQYKDYAYWQQEKEQQQNYSNKKEFWISEYKAPFEKLNLPIDYEYPLLRSNKGNSIDFVIEEVYVKKLQSIAQSVDGTFFMGLFSVFSVFLSKISNTDDIIIGSPVVGREHSSLEGIVGMFVNTLAIRNDVNSDQVFHEFLINVKNKITQCINNQSYQYEELIEALGVSRDTSRNPLFDVMIVHIENERKLDEYQINDVVFKEYLQESTTAKFDLLLKSVITNGELQGRFQYNTDIFSEATIRRLIKHFTNLLKQIATRPKVKIKDLKLLEFSDQKVLLENFNSTDKLYDIDKTFSTWFTEQAQKTPTAIALTLGNKELTYEALETQSNQLARHLSSLGVTSNSVVGILQHRSMEVIISILGVLKSGGAYLPIDHMHPKSRVSAMISDSEMLLLLTDNQTNEFTFESDISKLNLSTFVYEDYDSEPLVNQNMSEDLLYILYTSGSTGMPKGVMLTHRNLVNLLDYHIHSTGINTSSVLQFTPLTFDPSFKEIFSALLTGGTLHLLTEEESKDFSMILSHIQEKEVRTIFMPSSILSQLFNNSIYKDELPTTLTNIVTAGEQVVVGDLFKAYLKKYLILLHNHYGPAETHVVTANIIIPTEDIPRTPHIGVPIQNTQIYILSEEKHIQPIGIVGELYIGGAQVGLGYLNREELTKERFINNPYDFGKLYRTGDLAKWNDDGTILFLGRIDHQVKINGIRIEPGEIENHICNIPEIKDSVVIVKEVAGEKVLVCYYIGDQEYTLEKLQPYLLDYLPVSMIPRYYVQMASFPTTANGKLYRKVLPEVVQKQVAYLPADTETEKQLLELWQAVLNNDDTEIGVTHSFFELGGNSLKAMVLINRINKNFSVMLLLRDIFQYQTIRSLAEYISGLEQEVFISIPKTLKKENYPLSSAQQRMYFLYEFDKESTTYNIPGVFEISGDLDIVHLKAVFLKLTERHESLRTVFELGSSGVVQRVLADYKFEIPFYQVSESEIKKHIGDFVRPFNLSLELPFRVSILSVGESKYILLVDMHHIISDGVSMEVLLRDFWSLYQRETLNSLRIQYKDYAVWQQSDVHKEQLAKERLYWENQYSDKVETLNLPYDYSRPKIKESSGSNISFNLSELQLVGLRLISSDNDSTMFMVMLSLFKLLLSKLSNQYDIIVGTPISGRHHFDLERTVGMFVNTLALRTSPSGDKFYKDYLSEVKETVLSSFENQNYQYEDLIDNLLIERDISRNPLFDVMFSYINERDKDFENMTSFIRPYNSEEIEVNSKFDVTMIIAEGKNHMGVTINYNKSLFKNSSVEKFLKYFDRLITTVISNPEILLGNIGLLNKEEQEIQLTYSSGEQKVYGENLTVLDMFKEQVLKNPEGIAIFNEKKEITYKELDDLTNYMATYLLEEREVKLGSFIGVQLLRGNDLIISMLSILKTGCVYVPIDPNWPADRILYITTDSSFHLLINDEFINHYNALSYKPKIFKPLSIKGNDLSYVIYTSGSTGRPKGVKVNHSNLVNLCLWHKSYYEIVPSSRGTIYSGIAFDASIWEIFPYLTSGAGLYPINDETLRLDIKLLINYITDNKITHCYLPTVVCSELVREGTTLPNTKVLTGGDALHLQKQAKFELYNNYGPTEATVVATCFNLKKAQGIIPIGRPILNTYTYILDAYGNLLPEGVIGELYIGGKGVSQGYLNNKELKSSNIELL